MDAREAEVQPLEVQSRSHAIREYLDAVFAQQSVVGDNGANHIYPYSPTPERGRVITELCRAVRPAATLEVGMAWGVSTLLILEGLIKSGAHFVPHVVIDPFQSSLFHDAATLALGKLGVEELVEFYDQPSELVLPHLLAQGRRFDFAFIDGDHRFDAAFTDFRFIHLLLARGGVILFDDTWLDSVHLTVRYAETNLGYREVEVPCAVPVYRSRPMLRAIEKPAEDVKRDGLWTEPLEPFFTDLVPGGSKNSASPADGLQLSGKIDRVLDDARRLLDRLDGEYRAARIVMKGGLYDLVGASTERAREAADAIDGVLRAARTLAPLADSSTADDVRELLESIAGAFALARTQRSLARLEEAARAIAKLKELFDQRTSSAASFR